MVRWWSGVAASARRYGVGGNGCTGGGGRSSSEDSSHAHGQAAPTTLDLLQPETAAYSATSTSAFDTATSRTTAICKTTATIKGGGVSVSTITSSNHHRFKSKQHSSSISSTEHTCNPIAAAVRRRMPLARRQSVAAGGCTGSGGACHQGAPTPSFFPAPPHHPRRITNATVAHAISGFGGRAMRYYRLWIYTCNTCLLAGALAFAAAAARTVLFDFRRQLVPQLALYQPSFLYAYLALVTQGGALQLLGCMAALRLSEKLLNAYWLLLLVLLFGDLVLGAFWAFRFERICQELRPALRLKFAQDYGSDEEFTDMWNRLEAESSCCGVTGPADYNSTFVQLPLPASCCLRPPEGGTAYVISPTPSTNANASMAVAGPAQPVTCEHHQHGCDDTVLAYLRATASLLAILGFCVLAFLKMCFLGILRYEIREMIQKIRLLRSELELPNANGAVPSCLIQHAPASGGGGLLRHANEMRAAAAAAAAAAANTQTMYRESGGGTVANEAGDSEREALLATAAATPTMGAHYQHQQYRSESAAEALSSPPTQLMQQVKNPNGNNNYEMREYRSHDNI